MMSTIVQTILNYVVIYVYRNNFLVVLNLINVMLPLVINLGVLASNTPSILQINPLKDNICNMME